MIASLSPLLISSENLPPEGRPERLTLDVGKVDPYGVERDVIDFEDRALCVQKPDELNH